MGLSNFPGPSEGVLPVLVMNTVLSVSLLKNMVRSVFQVMNVMGSSDQVQVVEEERPEIARERRISVAQYKPLCHKESRRERLATVECCVCLCGFEAEQEVSELSCNHLFHKGCLDKWFHNHHPTCPLCRSIH